MFKEGDTYNPGSLCGKLGDLGISTCAAALTRESILPVLSIMVQPCKRQGKLEVSMDKDILGHSRSALHMLQLFYSLTLLDQLLLNIGLLAQTPGLLVLSAILYPGHGG
ncbi:hypothetical protein GOODEAATRI_009959 [Goodea atripinnis]|uniref:Uncharacterized protein n=1 Tax=Goodea atripinnis TaxID=208336 RepID=A0ABV0PMV1_9TELE